jgi:hypothetical protein
MNPVVRARLIQIIDNFREKHHIPRAIDPALFY